MPASDQAFDRLRELGSALREDADEWCTGRGFVAPRALLFGYLLYASLQHLRDAMYRSWFAGVTLAFHEMGHLLFVPLGQTMTILGGSLMQLIVPIVVGMYLWFYNHDWFGMVVSGFWLAFSTFELATYVADANREELPLVGLSERPEHDWSTLLTQWHVLNECEHYATVLRTLAGVQALLCSALGAYLLWQLWRLKDVPRWRI